MISSINPANGELVARFDPHGEDRIEAALAGASKAHQALEHGAPGVEPDEADDK